MKEPIKIPILMHDGRVTIRAFPDRMEATIHGFFDTHADSHKVDKKFPHVEDLFLLSFHGLLKLAEEFYNEILSGDQSEHNA